MTPTLLRLFAIALAALSQSPVLAASSQRVEIVNGMSTETRVDNSSNESKAGASVDSVKKSAPAKIQIACLKAGTTNCRSIIIYKTCADRLTEGAVLETSCTYKTFRKIDLQPGQTVTVENIPASFKRCEAKKDAVPSILECIDEKPGL